jgi:hypothetical protein
VGVKRAQPHLYLFSSRRRMLRGKAVEADASPFLRSAAAALGAKLIAASAPSRILGAWRFRLGAVRKRGRAADPAKKGVP